jgi:hypothetical protein
MRLTFKVRRCAFGLGQLDDSDFAKVREEFWKLYK